MIGYPKNIELVNKIRKLVKEAGKEGVWISTLAKKCDTSEQQINYYVDGRILRGKYGGGYLKDEIVTLERWGRNRVLVMKEYVGEINNGRREKQ